MTEPLTTKLGGGVFRMCPVADQPARCRESQPRIKIAASTSGWLSHGPKSVPVLWYSHAQNAPPCGDPQREWDHGREHVSRQVDVEQDNVMGREGQAGEDDGQRVQHERVQYLRTHAKRQRSALLALYEELGIARSRLACELSDGRLSPSPSTWAKSIQQRGQNEAPAEPERSGSAGASPSSASSGRPTKEQEFSRVEIRCPGTFGGVTWA